MNRTPPDLSTREGRRAYRRELRTVAVKSRRIGLMILVAGLMVGLLPIMGVHAIAGWSPRFLALLLSCLGALLLIVAITLRTRYHQQRMRGVEIPARPTPPPA